MLKKVLKPILIILIALSSLILLIFLGTGGFLYDFGMLENSLIEYYSNDDSYETLTGEIIKIENSSLFIIKILSDNPNFTNHVTNIEIEFDIFGDDNWYESAYNNFAVGDIITFISAPMSFYNGQFIPIERAQTELQ